MCECRESTGRLAIPEGTDHRLGHLGLDQQRAARPLRVDDDLRVGDVGDGVERDRAQRMRSPTSIVTTQPTSHLKRITSSMIARS